MLSVGETIFIWLESILSSFDESIDCFLAAAPLEMDFCTRWVAELGLEGLGALLLASGLSVSGLTSVCSGLVVPQWHFCFRGMAAVTAPQPQG